MSKCSKPGLACLNSSWRWKTNLSLDLVIASVYNKWIDCPRCADTKASSVTVRNVRSYSERYSAKGCFLNIFKTTSTSQIQLYLGVDGLFRDTPFMNLMTSALVPIIIFCNRDTHKSRQRTSGCIDCTVSYPIIKKTSQKFQNICNLCSKNIEVSNVTKFYPFMDISKILFLCWGPPWSW